MQHLRGSDPNAQSPTSGARNGNEEKPVRVNELSSRTCYQQSCHLFLSFLLLLGNDLMNRCYGLKPSLPSIRPNQPFVVVWNAPTARCESAYKVPLNLNAFSIIHNIKENFTGDNIIIFYHKQLGYYPFYHDEEPVNGGCPQNNSLQSHLEKVVVDLKKYMPQSFSGLAVIDWEEWRPLWIRNWGKKDIYRRMSEKLVRKVHPCRSTNYVKQKAQLEYETAGQDIMSRTLELARIKHPDGKWGYYLFPECYNYDYKNNFENFTGACPSIEIKRNNQLKWLWEESTALYPSIYIEEVLKSSNQANKFVKGKMVEAMRVAQLASTVYFLPVYAYTRPFYTYTLKPLSLVDLIITIGQTAALGVQGIVIWGSAEYSRNKTNCQFVQNYLKTTLGPYIINVTTAAKLCSEFMCNSNGRCLRKNFQSDTYLHLNSDSFRIEVLESINGTYVSVTGSMGLNEKEKMKRDFMCHCYHGYAGAQCLSSSKGLKLTWQWDWCTLTAISCGLLFLGHL
ncbi:hyaluronidase-4-like [Microcaecilia unicolor]|uniref:Hyaluronidase n=1 Tax=Microcaecilia unicolor TaxID=1415580 RepID=A0A6P7YIX4_9AMPH|nr:hyaluronidase-4-like [Microcaecilia unicolor]